MNENKEEVETEKVSYNRYPDESTKKEPIQQSEHLKDVKKHPPRDNENETVKESYNRIPTED